MKLKVNFPQWNSVPWSSNKTHCHEYLVSRAVYAPLEAPCRSATETPVQGLQMKLWSIFLQWNYGRGLSNETSGAGQMAGWYKVNAFEPFSKNFFFLPNQDRHQHQFVYLTRVLVRHMGLDWMLFTALQLNCEQLDIKKIISQWKIKWSPSINMSI